MPEKKKILSVKVVKHRNILPSKVAKPPSLGVVKNRLDKYLSEMF